MLVVNGPETPHEQTGRLGWKQDFGYDGRGYGYVRYCKERFAETARPASRVTRRRGEGALDDRASKPHGTAAPARRRTARDPGDQGQERRRGRGGAEVVTVQDQPLRTGPDRTAAAGGRAAARLLPDHRVPPRAAAHASRGRRSEGLVGGLLRQPVRGLPAVHRVRARGRVDVRLACRRGDRAAADGRVRPADHQGLQPDRADRAPDDRADGQRPDAAPADPEPREPAAV